LGQGSKCNLCCATVFVKFAVYVIRFGSATALGAGAPLPDTPYFHLRVVGGLAVGMVLVAKVTGGIRK